MKITKRIAVPIAAFTLILLPVAARAQYGPPPPPPGAYGQGPGYGPGGWDAPPNEYTRDLQRNAFRDGIEGGRRDLENHRRVDVRNRDEFRNYRGPERRVYRQAFQAGYYAFWRHQGYRGY